jgi:hypothetical protein
MWATVGATVPRSEFPVLINGYVDRQKPCSPTEIFVISQSRSNLDDCSQYNNIRELWSHICAICPFHTYQLYSYSAEPTPVTSHGPLFSYYQSVALVSYKKFSMHFVHPTSPSAQRSTSIASTCKPFVSVGLRQVRVCRVLECLPHYKLVTCDALVHAACRPYSWSYK